jgi:hypothetical protein
LHRPLSHCDSEAAKRSPESITTTLLIRALQLSYLSILQR